MKTLTFHTTKIRDKIPINSKNITYGVLFVSWSLRSEVEDFDLETWPVLHDDHIETLIKHNPCHTTRDISEILQISLISALKHLKTYVENNSCTLFLYAILCSNLMQTTMLKNKTKKPSRVKQKSLSENEKTTPPKEKIPELANGKCVLSSIRTASVQTFLYEPNLVDVSYTTKLVSSDSHLFRSLQIYLNWKNNSLKACRNHSNCSSARKMTITRRMESWIWLKDEES